MSRLPPLFKCHVCGLELRPGDNTVSRMAVVWLKSKGTTISRVIEEKHIYKHEFCDDKGLDGSIQDSLF